MPKTPSHQIQKEFTQEELDYCAHSQKMSMINFINQFPSGHIFPQPAGKMEWNSMFRFCNPPMKLLRETKLPNDEIRFIKL